MRIYLWAIKENAMTASVSRTAVEAFLQAYASGNPGRIARFIAVDVEWMIIGPVDLLQFCGHRKGKAAVMKLFEREIPGVLQVVGVETDMVLVDGDCAATHGRIVAIQQATDRTICFRCAQFMRFRDGKVIEYRAIIDSFDAAEQVLGHPIALAAGASSLIAVPA
jgi:ketosteroid isomerase-like protein